jgi:hypothetical protein
MRRAKYNLNQHNYNLMGNAASYCANIFYEDVS